MPTSANPGLEVLSPHVHAKAGIDLHRGPNFDFRLIDRSAFKGATQKSSSAITISLVLCLRKKVNNMQVHNHLFHLLKSEKLQRHSSSTVCWRWTRRERWADGGTTGTVW